MTIDSTANYPYLVAVSKIDYTKASDNSNRYIQPVDAITNRSKTDGTVVTSSLSDSDLNKAATAARGKDVAFVFITADSGEGQYTVENNSGDRNDLLAWHSGVCYFAL